METRDRMQDIIQQALRTGYLTIEAENQLRKLLRGKCKPEDIKAFMKLQQAAMEGVVRQEARELLYHSPRQAESCQGKMALAY